MEGWIKMHRKFLAWEWYSDVNVKCVMLHLLLKANHKDGRWRGIEVKRGACITGIFSLCEELNMSKSKINTALKKLKSSGEIGIKTTNKYSMISITNYASFQSNEKQIGNKSETNRKQIVTNKNEKNEKNEKTVVCAPPAAVYQLFMSKLMGLIKIPKIYTKENDECVNVLSEKYLYSAKDWNDFFETIKNSVFLTSGLNEKNWTPDFSWIVSEKNAVNIINGKYTDGNEAMANDIEIKEGQKKNELLILKAREQMAKEFKRD